MKALVIDDVKQNCRVMQALLARYGTCDTAATGREGVASFHNAWKKVSPYELIILDIMLPDMDGLKVLEVVRKMEGAMNVAAEQRAHVLIVSSMDPSDHIMKARELGFDAWITKPIFHKELVEALRRCGLVE